MKESEKECSCPNCGYRMFKTPYNRKEIIISEIDRFVSCLETTTVTRDDLIFTDKEKDDNRFPNYDRILKYVSQRERTEDFLYNLLETVEQLKLHYTSGFSDKMGKDIVALFRNPKQIPLVFCKRTA